MLCRFLLVFILCFLFDFSKSDNVVVVINYCGCSKKNNEEVFSDNYYKIEESSEIDNFHENPAISATSAIYSESNNTCPQESQIIENLDHQIIEWPETDSGKSAVSDPLCIDENLRIMKRFCNDDTWDDAPDCKTVQKPINPCPPDLTSVNAKYCYKIIEKTRFPPVCPYPGELGWEKVLELGIFPIGPVWMPLKRADNEEQGIDVLRWTEISDKYFTPFQICTQSCQTFFYSDTFLDKECQIYHNSTHIEAVSCDAQHSAICIYDALDKKPSSLCSQKYESCRQAGYGPESMCFCKTTEQNVEQKTLAEFLEPYQSLLFKNQRCRIGLENSDCVPSFKWISSQLILNYTSWSPEVDFDEKFGLQTPTGWIFSEKKEADCYLYQIDSPKNLEANLSLVIEGVFYKLTLINYSNFFTLDNNQPLVYCFTDADAQTIVYRLPNQNADITRADNNYTMKFAPIDLDQSGPGNYWCTAFLYPDLKPVTSERVNIMNFLAEYVVVLRLVDYDEKLSKYPLTSENLQTLQNLFKNELPSNITFFPRIFKINGINETAKEINLTFHLTSSRASSTLEEFYQLKSVTENQKTFEILNFHSVLYCPESVTLHGDDKIYWPTIEAVNRPTVTYPSNDGHCVTRNVTLIRRTCSGNFVDGVYWSEIAEACSYFPKSILTDDLIAILDRFNDDDDKEVDLRLRELQKLTEMFDSFNTLDFALAVKFIERIADARDVDLDVISAIVSNLMNVSKVTLSSAQINFKSTDFLLKSIDILWENGNVGEWNKPNFAVRSINLKNNAIFGYKLTREFILLPIENNTKNELFNKTMISEQKITSAIILSEKLYQQILNYQQKNSSYVPKLIIIFYYGSQLFVEIENSRTSDVVFGVLLPDFPQNRENLFEGPVSMYYFNNLENKFLQYNCSYWKFDELAAGNWAMENTEEISEALVCEFYHLTNFAVAVAKIPEISSKLVVIVDKLSQIIPESIQLLAVTDEASIYGKNGNYWTNENFAIEIFQNDYDKHTGLVLKNNNFSIDLIDSNFFVDIDEKISTIFDVLLQLFQKPFVIYYFKNSTLIQSDWQFNDNNNYCISNNFTKSEFYCKDNLEEDLMNFSLESLTNFKSSNDILIDIDRILSQKQDTNYIKNENISFVTISKKDAKHFQGFYVTNDKEIFCIFTELDFKNLDFKMAVVFDAELQRQIRAANSNLAFAIFFNEMLFSSAENIQLPLVAVLIPKLKNNQLQGNIVIKYKTAKNNGVCSYWRRNYWQQESKASFSKNDNISTCNFNHVTHFALIYNLQNITANLQEILQSNLTAREKLVQVNSIITFNPSDLVAIDIYLISQILAKSLTEVGLISKIISALFTVNRDVLREAQLSHSATDIILNSVDELAKIVDDDVLIQHFNFSLIVKKFNIISGLKLYDCLNFKCKIELLNNYNNNNMSEFTNNNSINAMILFSQDLVKQISNNKIAISLYYNDALFNEAKIRKTSQIFGVTFPGLNDNLSGNVTVIVKTTSDNNQCAYWHFNATSGWLNESKDSRENLMSICSYSHVTHLGMLLGSNNKYDDDSILDLVTDIGCILSLFGIVVILMTAIFYKKWRQNTGNIILINFSIAIMLKIVTLYVSVYLKKTTFSLFCTITGIFLHYATLSECTWMLTVAILQFKRFVEVLGGPPKYVLVKALICGWLFPVIPVICVIALDPGNYREGFASLCYPSDLGLYLGVWLPVLLILAINCVIFVFIVYNVFHKKIENNWNNSDIFFQWRLALLLFFMLGLNGVFGFLGQINSEIVFIYLYTITASLQGFVLFLFFIVVNKSTRFLYSQSIKKWFYARGIFKIWQHHNSKPTTSVKN